MLTIFRSCFGIALLGILVGCANRACACPALPCPGCENRAATLQYVGSFISGKQQLPVQFTGLGETATITMQVIEDGHSVPLAPVSGAPLGTCTAATLQQLGAPGEIQVTSVASGTCTFSLSSAGVTAPAQVNVP